MNGYEIYRCIGILIYLMLLFFKLLWMKEEELELYISVYKFIFIKEYVIY